MCIYDHKKCTDKTELPDIRRKPTEIFTLLALVAILLCTTNNSCFDFSGAQRKESLRGKVLSPLCVKAKGE